MAYVPIKDQPAEELTVDLEAALPQVHNNEAQAVPALVDDSIKLTAGEKKAAFYLALLVAGFTSINYGFTSAAQAAKYETPAQQWGLGAYFVACSVVANAYFDVLAVEEDLALPLKQYVHRVRGVGSYSEGLWEAAKFALGLLVVFGAFNTSFTTKIPGQEGIETFSGDWPDWSDVTLQVANDIYALVFVTALFSSGTFQLPSMVSNAFKPKNTFELRALVPSLAIGLFLGLGAYKVFANTLEGFPEHQGEFHDPFNYYLASLITVAPWMAYVSALTRGSFCVLFAQRGLVELTKQVAAIFKSSFDDLPVRLSLLAFTGFVAFGSIAPSAFQAGDHEDLGRVISACAFFVNAYGLAVRLRTQLEYDDSATPATRVFGCIRPIKPIDKIFEEEPEVVESVKSWREAIQGVFCCSRRHGTDSNVPLLANELR